MNTLDFILLAFVAVVILVALWKGFIHSAIELAGFLVTLPAAIFCANRGAEWAYESFVHERLVREVTQRISDGVMSPSELANALKGFVDSLPSSVNGFLDSLHIDLNQIIGQISSASATSAAEQFVNSALRPIAIVLCTLVLFVVFFIVFSILVKILAFVAGHLPLPGSLKKADHALGGVLGALRALLLVFLVSAALQIAVDTAGSYLNQGFTDSVKESVIVKAVNQYNPVLDKLIKS